MKYFINLILIYFQSINKGCSCQRKVASVKTDQHSNTEVVDTGSGMETQNHTNGMAVTVIRMDTRLWPPTPTTPPSHTQPTNLTGSRDINIGRDYRTGLCLQTHRSILCKSETCIIITWTHFIICKTKNSLHSM